MKTGIDFLKNLLNALLPNRAAPVLARVMKVYEGPGKNKYSCDVKVLTAGSLEETDQEIAEVPINPIWADKTNKGIYAPPPEGGIVIIGFLEWNVAYPYVAGVYSDEYTAQKFKKGQLVITDGKDLRIEFSDDEILIHDTHKFEARFIKGKCNVINDRGLKVEVDSDAHVITADNGKIKTILKGDKCAVRNGSQSLFTILDTHIQNVHDLLIGLLPLGTPPTMCVSALDKIKLIKDKTDLAQLLEE